MSESREAEQPIRILSASVDSSLNQSRAMLLRHHGFDVKTSESLEHAREQIAEDLFDVLIFGSTLPRDVCWQLAEVFRQRNTSGRVVEILPSPWTAPKNRPAATVIRSGEAAKLISAIRAENSDDCNVD
jgi:hypothetical protein